MQSANINNNAPSTDKKNAKKLRFRKNFIKNPNLSYLNIDSNFIYSEEDFKSQFTRYKNKNLFKLTEKEESYLTNIINEINFENSLKANEEFIELDINFYNKINNLRTRKVDDDEVTNYVKNKILNNTNRAGLSCRKIADSYFNETGKTIGKSTIHKIIRHKLGYRYLKTTNKSNYLKTNIAITSCLIFIKLIVKYLMRGFQFIYIDETSIQLNNNHYRCWRFPNEAIYFGDSKK